MPSHQHAVNTLETELTGVHEVFAGLTSDDWARTTNLEPLDPTLPHWTVFELAGHFDISIGLTRMLMADPTEGQPGRDRTSFFIFPRAEVAPVVYDYAYTMVKDRQPDQMADVLRETFTRTVQEARESPPDLVGPGYYALMRLDEFVVSRVLEAVVHGMDLTDALAHDSIATPDGIAMTAEILDDLLARRTVAGRPPDLADDLSWIRAASGRGPHPDPRLPLIG
jgi:hypothetical protein